MHQIRFETHYCTDLCELYVVCSNHTGYWILVGKKNSPLRSFPEKKKNGQKKMYHTQLGLDWRTKKKWANQTSFFFLVFTSTTYSLNISACSCKWNVCWYCIKGFSVIRQYTVRTSHTVLANDVNYVHIILQNVPFIPSIHPSIQRYSSKGTMHNYMQDTWKGYQSRYPTSTY